MFVFVILALGDLFWSSIVTSVALVLVAGLARQSAKRIADIDRAVNGQGDGQPTLVSRVVDQDVRSVAVAAELAEFRAYTQGAFDALARVAPVDVPDAPEPVAPVELILPNGVEHPPATE